MLGSETDSEKTSKEERECFVSRLHERQSMIPRNDSASSPTRAMHRSACSRVEAVKTHVGTARRPSIEASCGSGATSE